MAETSFDSVRQARSQFPRLSSADIDAALDVAKKPVSEAKREELLKNLNAAFHQYLSARISLLAFNERSPAATAKRLKQMSDATDRLINMIGGPAGNSVQGEWEPEYFLWCILCRQANLHGRKIGGYPECPPTGVRERDYRGEEKARALIDGLRLLQTLLEEAHQRERTEVKSASERDRSKADHPLLSLFSILNNIWTNRVGGKPAVSWNFYERKADGPYIRFLESIIGSLVARLPVDLKTSHPKLAGSLPSTPSAIKGWIQRSRKLASATTPPKGTKHV